jgi:hypothetical protein
MRWALLPVVAVFASGCDGGGQSFGWRELSVSTPGARGHHLMFYEPAGERIISVGGYRGDWTDHLWQWDGEAWTELATTAPMTNKNAIAFDHGRGRAVEAGDHGRLTTRPVAYETWEWDGAAWQQAGAAPGSAEDTALAYDAARGQVVMFGGYVNQLDGSTYVWDGSEWQLVATDGPAPRRYHAMAYDVARQRVVLFGGSTSEGTQADTWEWDGVCWTLAATSGPPPRNSHAMAYASARETIVLHGGGGRNDTWEWDGTQWRLLVEGGPRGRDKPSIAYDEARAQLVLFGGMLSFGTGILDDMWVLDLE